MWDFAAVNAAEISLSTLLFASFLLSLLFSSLGLWLSGCCVACPGWHGGGFVAASLQREICACYMLYCSVALCCGR